MNHQSAQRYSWFRGHDMRQRSAEEEEITPQPNDFGGKVNDPDFDPWGDEDDDATARRLDPLRRPAGRRPAEQAD